MNGMHWMYKRISIEMFVSSNKVKPDNWRLRVVWILCVCLQFSHFIFLLFILHIQNSRVLF